MLRAVLVKGRIEAIGPLPPEWRDGQELVVDQADTGTSIESMVSPEELLDSQNRATRIRNLGEGQFGPGEWEQVQSVIDEQRRASKEHVRRQMGL